MVIAQDTTNLHFDDVFVIYTNNFEYGVSCSDYIYFSEDDAKNEMEELNRAYPILKHYVCTLTEYIERYGEGKYDEGSGGARTSMSFND
jgi:hypothetical protein